MSEFFNEEEDKAFEEMVRSETEKDVWTTRKGEKIPIKDLKDSHLINIIRILNSKGYVSPETVAAYVSGPEPNGDGAQMAFQTAFDQVMDSPVCHQLEVLEEEVKKRGLEIPEEETEENVPTGNDEIYRIERYREIRNQIAGHEEELAHLNRLRKEIEMEMFAEIKIGTYKDVEEFRFEAKTGKRGLSPRVGFESTWKNLIADCEVPEEKEKLEKLVTSKTVHKGPTLGQLEKMMQDSEYLRDHYEQAKITFGYSEGSRRETITIIDKAEDDSIPGLYCHSKVAGTTYRGELPWDDFKMGDVLQMIREPNNQVDRNAIKLIWNNEAHIGYIRGELAQTLAPMMDGGTEFYATIAAITGGGAHNYGCNIDIIYK